MIYLIIFLRDFNIQSSKLLYPSFSLGSLYPAGSADAARRSETAHASPHFSGEIPIKDLTLKYSCSGGPGGQNVNKVATKVDMRYKGRGEISQIKMFNPNL